MVDSEIAAGSKQHFDVDHAFIAHLNTERQPWAGMDSAALEQALLAQGAEWYALVKERCPHLFATVPVFISALQLQQMQAVIAAVAEVAVLPAFNEGTPADFQPLAPGVEGKDLGVFYGYDFHLNEAGAHLIEINTNAGGAFLNAVLIESQQDATLYGSSVSEMDLEQVFIDMFRREWRLARGDAPLKSIAIVDEQPAAQYLYPEFLLAQRCFERAGIKAYIADPADLMLRADGLYCNDVRIDLIYNRLTDFALQQFPHLHSAWDKQQVVLTPNPAHYQCYADKRKLALLSDAAWLRGAGVSQASIDGLLQGVPCTNIVRSDEAERWWSERKQCFFKPVNGYGSKGAYRGDKLTKRVFEEIMQSDYVAQKLAPPGERQVPTAAGEMQTLKFDVRCYVYDGNIQLIAARLYQGQTTNFRTPNGGFALVRVVE